MKKLVNGKIIEMTPDEIAAWEQEVAQQPAPEPTPNHTRLSTTHICL